VESYKCHAVPIRKFVGCWPGYTDNDLQGNGQMEDRLWVFVLWDGSKNNSQET
jgi:hypothetical protein